MVLTDLGGDMGFNYEQAEQEFKKELEKGDFSIEILPNNGPNRREKEAADVAAFEAYMNSDDFKTFDEEVSRK
jgi:hypothetical protein